MEGFTRLSEGSPLKDSMFSDRESVSTTSNLSSLGSSVASSYKYPSSRGLFSNDYEPFSLDDVQQKHKAMMTARDFGCDERRNDSHGNSHFLRILFRCLLSFDSFGTCIIYPSFPCVHVVLHWNFVDFICVCK